MMETAETVLAALQATHQPPATSGKLNVAERFRRFRSDEWGCLAQPLPRDAAGEGGRVARRPVTAA